MTVRSESADAARNTIDDSESRIEQLEHQLQKCIIEKNDLEMKMEEAVQDSGKFVCFASFSFRCNLVELQLFQCFYDSREKRY